MLCGHNITKTTKVTSLTSEGNPEHGSARQTFTNTEAARSQMFFEIGVRQNSQYSKENTCGGMSFQIY